MTFKREISIDGVAVITASIALIAFMVSLKLTQAWQGEQLSKETQEITQMSQTQQSLAESVAVLTTIVNERTERRNVIKP